MPDITPNYLTTNSAGQVSAVFPGGVEILAGENDTPPTERRVRWVREDDGSLVADIYSYDNSFGAGATLGQRAIGSQAQVDIAAQSNEVGGSDAASISLQNHHILDFDTSARIMVSAKENNISVVKTLLLHENGGAANARVYSDFWDTVAMDADAGPIYGGVGTVYNTLDMECRGGPVVILFSGRVRHDGTPATTYNLNADCRIDGVAQASMGSVTLNVAGWWQTIGGVWLATPSGGIHTFTSAITSVTATPALGMYNPRLIVLDLAANT